MKTYLKNIIDEQIQEVLENCKEKEHHLLEDGNWSCASVMVDAVLYHQCRRKGWACPRETIGWRSSEELFILFFRPFPSRSLPLHRSQSASATNHACPVVLLLSPLPLFSSNHPTHSLSPTLMPSISLFLFPLTCSPSQTGTPTRHGREAKMAVG